MAVEVLAWRTVCVRMTPLSMAMGIIAVAVAVAVAVIMLVPQQPGR